MNRLIIIGNGFDLAHDLKTSYSDFICDYLINSCKQFLSDLNFRDPLTHITCTDSSYLPEIADLKLTKESIKEDFNLIRNNRGIQVRTFGTTFSNSLDKILNYKWADLETAFFEELYSMKHIHKGESQVQQAKIINDRFEHLKKLLIEYLKKEQNKLDPKTMDMAQIINCFTELFNNKQQSLAHIPSDSEPENLYFLNFNYTKTAEIYAQKCNTIISSECNYIHGSIDRSYGNPIFGFGDELSKKYLEFEDEMNNELFRHIKSFEYLKTSNYNSLLRFIESGEFQVQIFGHSCGISDRTMLNHIFEHMNCKSIKLFYYQNGSDNDFTDKTYEISRHFTKNKGDLREKLVPMDASIPMPQPIFANVK